MISISPRKRITTLYNINLLVSSVILWYNHVMDKMGDFENIARESGHDIKVVRAVLDAILLNTFKGGDREMMERRLIEKMPSYIITTILKATDNYYRSHDVGIAAEYGLKPEQIKPALRNAYKDFTTDKAKEEKIKKEKEEAEAAAQKTDTKKTEYVAPTLTAPVVGAGRGGVAAAAQTQTQEAEKTDEKTEKSEDKKDKKDKRTEREGEQQEGMEELDDFAEALTEEVLEQLKESYESAQEELRRDSHKTGRMVRGIGDFLPDLKSMCMRAQDNLSKGEAMWDDAGAIKLLEDIVALATKRLDENTRSVIERAIADAEAKENDVVAHELRSRLPLAYNDKFASMLHEDIMQIAQQASLQTMYRDARAKQRDMNAVVARVENDPNYRDQYRINEKQKDYDDKSY